jgi:hypothetical protein
VCCFFILIMVIFTPPSDAKYLYVVLKNDITFSHFIKTIRHENAQIVDNGAINNSYIIYSDDGFTSDFSSDSSIKISFNPLFTQGCSVNTLRFNYNI